MTTKTTINREIMNDRCDHSCIPLYFLRHISSILQMFDVLLLDIHTGRQELKRDITTEIIGNT